MNFRMSLLPLDPAVLQKELIDASAGASVTFEGWVRDHNDGRKVRALDYESFIPLAEREGGRILEEARSRFEVVALTCGRGGGGGPSKTRRSEQNRAVDRTVTRRQYCGI